MASKFQNRLVGTVILVALVVIFLPDMLDGQKIAQKDESFATIPLRPELEPAKPALQVSAASTLPEQHAASQQQAAEAEQWQVEEVPDTVTLGQSSTAAPETQTKAVAPVVVAKQPEPKPAVKPEPKPAAKPAVKPESKPASQAGQIKTMDDLLQSKQLVAKAPEPAQGSWILQLGAFRNKDSVNALVGKLRAAGYSAHTVPRTPVQGQINRVFIGPDVSRAKLQGIQSKVSQLTGLSGSVVAYNP
ncbi:cell division protein DedD [Aeromonas bivalvium]|uniref:Cell division protein DedD n=1 Tax=Aeromonas bivalvium TaxID=440079 RepID=A0ABW9GL08_9GAMM